MELTIDKVKGKGWLIFEAITGSRAYGLDTPNSDTDIRGVFILPKEEFYSLRYTAQVSNHTNDIVYYELGRFIELLTKNNPNILELLGTPESNVLLRHESMKAIKLEWVLSRLCEQTFANYAFTQIKKAYGLEKKILNPMAEERKSVLDFCFAYHNHESMSARQFLSFRGWKQEDIGLAVIPHLKDCFNLYYSSENIYSGIVKKETSNEVSLSSIPKGESPAALLYFNRDGYSVYCKKYAEYQEWINKRNDERYKNTMSHGKKYDAKNMMHVFRLLLMAKEIATEKRINVFRKDRGFLMDIKAGKFEYDELIKKAEELKADLPALYEQSGLPDNPDVERLNELLVEMRESFYK